MAELRLIPQKTWTDYLKLAEATVSRFKSHEEWEDIAASVRFEVCRALARLPQKDAECAWRLVKKVAREAVFHWLRSPENPSRTETRKTRGHGGKPLPALISWEWAWESPLSVLPTGMVVPDFAPRLIHRLWAEEVAKEAFALMSPGQQARVRRYLADLPVALPGEAQSDAQALFAGALNRYLKAKGLPVKRYGRETLRRSVDPAHEREKRAMWARNRYQKSKQARKEGLHAG